MSQYEQIQALVLQTLDKSPNGEIPDSRELNLSTPEAQTTLKAVLDSLLSKEVGLLSTSTLQGDIGADE
jgi:hypothetical protein